MKLPQDKRFRRVRRVKIILVIFVSVTAISLCLIGFLSILHSPLFYIKNVEVVESVEKVFHSNPVDAQTLIGLVNIQPGTVNLFDLKLSEIEKRILSHSWISDVKLQKKFPQTLSLSVTFHKPEALFQHENGELSYVDENGKVFDQLNLMIMPDLPVLSGFKSDGTSQIVQALKLIKMWEQQGLSNYSFLVGFHYDSERGYQAWLTYPLFHKSAMSHENGRTALEMGQEFNSDFEIQLGRIKQVIKYLGSHNIASRYIMGDVGKKIIVKIAPSS